MSKKMEYEEHKDLKEFEKKYNSRINEFLESMPETRVAFLNADFGWGKTTFIKNNLKVPENLIYSPWLNKSENYLEEIYYNVTKKNKGVLSSFAVFISVVLMMITIISSSIISILIELNKSNVYEMKWANFKIICSTTNSLSLLLRWLIFVIIIMILLVGVFIFIKPIPIINFFKRDNSKYYENRVIKNIVKKMDKVLVIEDIDRADDIEDILIAANKISEYIKKEKLDKYILITGDYIRTIIRINESNKYDNNVWDISVYRNRGTFTVEKIISLRIDFSNICERINTLLEEKKLRLKLKKIEYDEIVAFIKNKYLSIRFFIRFLDKYKVEIENSNSLYHLLLKHYQEEKYFNISDNAIEKSIYNIERFPNCINDIEMMLQKNGIIINDKKYTGIEIKDDVKNNYDIINNAFSELFFIKNKESIRIFKEFYLGSNFPILLSDKARQSAYTNSISIGDTLKPTDLKTNLDNYLLGYNNNMEPRVENILLNKRCYFSAQNSSNDFEIYKIKDIDISETKEVLNDEFIFAYIAVFFKKNDSEIKKNYPKIAERILQIIE